jgi:hypothetical protein
VTKPTLTLALVSLLVPAFASGCFPKKKDDSDKPAATATAKPAPPPPPPPAPPPAPDVAFAGKYTKFAEATWKNGQKVRVANENGTASIVIGSGRVTFAQTYKVRGKVQNVTQVYTYAAADAKPATGGFDLAIVYQSISGDTQSYNPDRINPRIEARKQAGGWEIGLTTTDAKGVMGGVEFH